MKTQAASDFRFSRPAPDGPVKIFNVSSYLMGEYNQRTGKVNWHRVVLAGQKTQVEEWLLSHYPPSKPATSNN